MLPFFDRVIFCILVIWTGVIFFIRKYIYIYETIFLKIYAVVAINVRDMVPVSTYHTESTMSLGVDCYNCVHFQSIRFILS